MAALPRVLAAAASDERDSLSTPRVLPELRQALQRQRLKEAFFEYPPQAAEAYARFGG